MNKYSAIKEIQNLAAEVPLGVDDRFLCPYCNGGSTREKSLSIRRLKDIEASYCCYRDSCDLGKGFIALHSESGIVFSARSRPVTKVIEYEAYPLSKEGAELLRTKYKLADLLIRYARIRHIHDKRFYIPIFSPTGRVRGYHIRKENKIYVGRKETASVPTKWTMLRDRNDPTLCWYRKGRNKKQASDTLIMVEDQLSALRCVPYSDSAGLMGTMVSFKAQREIREHSYGDIILALDEDATGTAFSLAERLLPYLPQIRIMPLPQDIKSMQEDQLEDLLRRYKIVS